MRRLLFILTFASPFLASGQGCAPFGSAFFTQSAAAAGNAFTYYMSVAIDHTKMGSSDQTNFTDIIYFTDADFADAAHGGKIQNSASVSVNGTSITMPTDLVFSTSITSTPLSSLAGGWTVIKWDNTTGEIQIATLFSTASHSSNSTLYIYYDASSVTTFQGGSTGSAFDTHYKLYMPFPDGSTLKGLDFTANNNSATSTPGATAISGKADGAVNVSDASSGNGVKVGDNLYHMCGSVATSTVSCWWRSSSSTPTIIPAIWDLQSSTTLGAFIEVTNTNNGYWWGYGGSFRTTTCPTESPSTWYSLITEKTAAGNNGNLYQNGSACTFSGSFGNPSNAGTSIIGDYHVGTGAVSVDIDEFSISDIARGADWATAVYNDINAPGTPSVAGFNIFGTKTHT